MLVTAFRSSVTDLVSLADAGQADRLTFNNARRVQVRGVEAEIEQRLRASARLRVAYGWQQARDPTAGADLTNSPRHLLKVQWSDALPTPRQWGWKPGRYAVEAIGIGTRRTLQNTRLPGHVLANLTYTTRVADMDVSVGVYNLFDHRHADPASFEIREDAIRQDGRTYRVKLTYAF